MSRQSFLDPAALLGAAQGDVIRLSDAEARHALVKRIAVGEQIDVVDGAGTRCVGELVSAGPDGVEVRVLELVKTEASASSVSTVLVQALAKQDRDLQAVETCVEIGIDAVIPWQAERSIVRWREERAAKAHAKWVNQVVAAVKQSRRVSLPPVEELHTSAALGKRIAAVTQAGGLVLVLHESAGQGLPDAVDAWLTSRQQDAPAEVLLLVGPEGGISPAEIERFQAAGALAVLVGSNVLRASTAGAVGLVLLRQALGAYSAA